MAADAIGFIRHSNLGTIRHQLMLAHVLKGVTQPLPLAHRVLTHMRIINSNHARGRSMTAEHFDAACNRAGLICVGQEIIKWGSKMIDCLSLVTRPGSRWDRLNVVVSNPDFMSEACSAGRIGAVYDRFGRIDRYTGFVRL